MKILLFNFMFQRILGIPESLISGNNAKPIVEVANNIWLACGLLLLLFSSVGIWMAQYQFIAKKTGGPAQYLNRVLTVGFSLLGYKIIFALIMWTGALVAYQILPAYSTPGGISVPWIPMGQLSAIKPASAATPAPNTSPTPSTTPGSLGTPPKIEDFKNKSTIEIIMWGVTSGLGIGFGAVPATIIIALCNILFAISLCLISAFWLTFAIVLYALGPFMITAGLIPEYGEKLWGSWLAATMQCSLWQVWMAFCGKLIISSLFMQISQFNPANRMESGGGELSGILMDLQQASYSLVFLILYLGTPFIVNFIFPISSGGNIGGFLLTATAALATKGTALAKKGAASGTKAAATKGTQGASNVKSNTSAPENNMQSTGTKSKGSVANSNGGNNQKGNNAYSKTQSGNEQKNQNSHTSNVNNSDESKVNSTSSSSTNATNQVDSKVNNQNKVKNTSSSTTSESLSSSDQTGKGNTNNFQGNNNPNISAGSSNNTTTGNTNSSSDRTANESEYAKTAGKTNPSHAPKSSQSESTGNTRSTSDNAYSSGNVGSSGGSSVNSSTSSNSTQSENTSGGSRSENSKGWNESGNSSRNDDYRGQNESYNNGHSDDSGNGKNGGSNSGYRGNDVNESNYGGSNGENYNSSSSQNESTSNTSGEEKPKYNLTREMPNNIRFGKLPEVKNKPSVEYNSESQTQDENEAD